MDDKLQDYKILSFNSGRPRITRFNDCSKSQVCCEFYKLQRIKDAFPIVILDSENNFVLWNSYFELEEIHRLIDSTFKELI